MPPTAVQRRDGRGAANHYNRPSLRLSPGDNTFADLLSGMKRGAGPRWTSAAVWSGSTGAGVGALYLAAALMI